MIIRVTSRFSSRGMTGLIKYLSLKGVTGPPVTLRGGDVAWFAVSGGAGAPGGAVAPGAGAGIGFGLTNGVNISWNAHTVMGLKAIIM